MASTIVKSRQVEPAGTTKQVQFNNAGSLSGASGVEIGNTNIRFLLESQAGTEVPFFIRAHTSQSADLFTIEANSGTDYVKWSSTGDLSVFDRLTSYYYSGEIRGGWHPTQIGFCVSPTWGYGFSNANNFNTIDASLMRSAAGVVKVIAGGLGSSTLGDLEVADETYGSSWNGSNEVPTKNAVYDKIETLSSGSGLTFTEVMRLKTIMN